jgi:hypothetical protein
VLPAVGAVMVRLLWVSNEVMESGVAKDDVHSLLFPSSHLRSFVIKWATFVISAPLKVALITLSIMEIAVGYLGPYL